MLKNKHIKYIFLAFLLVLIPGSVSATIISSTDFESGNLSDWNLGGQTGTLTSGNITQSGTGVTIVNGSVNFNAPSHNAVGSPTLSDGSPNPYYAPAVSPAVWSFSAYGNYAVALQPKSEVTFDNAMVSLGLSSTNSAALKSLMSSQAAASGYGSGNPTDAAWITKSVTLSAGVTYKMSWNYIGTDYVPFNDGSITSLVYLGNESNVTVSVNNSPENYALLGFTNPGTGDYSTGTYGSTGWQVSTYEVSVTGEYLLGFAVFNLDDTGLSPVLLVDSEPGNTIKDGEPFGAVVPNNPNAPTVAPTTTEPAPTSTEPAPTTTEVTPTTTQAAPTTTEVVENHPIIYIPPVTEAPETTSATTTSTATTVPEMEIENSIPIMDEIVELPKTGNTLNIFIGGFILIVSGLFICLGRNSKIIIPRRKV